MQNFDTLHESQGSELGELQPLREEGLCRDEIFRRRQHRQLHFPTESKVHGWTLVGGVDLT